MQHLGPFDGRPELLVLRALKLGDLLVAVPAIHGLRRAFPGHRLVLAVPGWLEPVVELIEGVDALLPTPGLDAPVAVEAGRVQIAVNMHGSGAESRTRVDELQPRLAMVHQVPEIDRGHPADARMPRWKDGILERERWVRLVGAYGVAADPDDVAVSPPAEPSLVPGAAVVHVGAFYGSRRWPADRFAQVARALREEGHQIVYTGDASERPRALEVAERAGDAESAVLAGRIDLGQFAALVAASRIVVSADTGAAHLASAFRRPSVILFGPAPPSEWGPPEGPHLVLTREELRRGETFGASPDPALLAITVEEVLDAVHRVLSDADGDAR